MLRKKDIGRTERRMDGRTDDLLNRNYLEKQKLYPALFSIKKNLNRNKLMPQIKNVTDFLHFL